MYDYVTSKPELEEALYHAGFHKYIDRYMGKNGKWVYVYNKAKKNIADAAYKTKNAIRGMQVRNQRGRLGFGAEDVSLDRREVVKNGKLYLVGVGYKGDSGRARSTGSSSGNKGYTRSIGSVLQGRFRAQRSRMRQEHEQKVSKQIESKGSYRPTSRKKKVGEGTGSVGRRGKGFNIAAAERRQLINGIKAGRARRMRNSDTMKSARINTNKKLAAERARRYRKAK